MIKHQKNKKQQKTNITKQQKQKSIIIIIKSAVVSNKHEHGNADRGKIHMSTNNTTQPDTQK